MVERSGQTVFIGVGGLTDHSVDRWRIEVGPAENTKTRTRQIRKVKTLLDGGFFCFSNVFFLTRFRLWVNFWCFSCLLGALVVLF